MDPTPTRLRNTYVYSLDHKILIKPKTKASSIGLTVAVSRGTHTSDKLLEQPADHLLPLPMTATCWPQEKIKAQSHKSFSRILCHDSKSATFHRKLGGIFLEISTTSMFVIFSRDEQVVVTRRERRRLADCSSSSPPVCFSAESATMNSVKLAFNITVLIILWFEVSLNHCESWGWLAFSN